MIKWYENRPEKLNEPIIPNFSLKEFICKCGKCQLTALDSKLLTLLNKLRSTCGFPLHINSAYRCQQHNREQVKGSKYSYHCRGMAVDIALPSDAKQKVLLLQTAKKFFPVVREYPDKQFVHCDVGVKRMG